MKHKVKTILKCIIFIVIFLILLHMLSILLVRKGNGYGTDIIDFYKQDKNSIDILYLGSSHAYSSFNPYLIEEETNLNGYVFATQQQPIWITYYYLKEALKNQKPKYVVLDVHMAVVQNLDYAEEQVNRDAIDKMKMSRNKIDVIGASVEKDKMSYYLNIIKYHSRYKELNWNDFKTLFFNYSIDNKGYIALPEEDYIFEYDNIVITDDILKISAKNEDYLNKIIEITKDNDIQVILVKTPAKYTEDEYKKLNHINNIADENKIPFINYIKNINSLNLDFEKDFYDEGHLNENGSKKLSVTFSKLINNLEQKKSMEVNND